MDVAEGCGGCREGVLGSWRLPGCIPAAISGVFMWTQRGLASLRAGSSPAQGARGTRHIPDFLTGWLPCLMDCLYVSWYFSLTKGSAASGRNRGVNF